MHVLMAALQLLLQLKEFKWTTNSDLNGNAPSETYKKEN